MEFQIPEDLTILSADELAAAEQEAIEEFDRLRNLGDDATDEQVAQMERLAQHVLGIRAEQQNRVNAADERQARIDAAAAVMAPPEDSTAPGEEEQTGEEDGDEDDDSEGEENPAEPGDPAAPQPPEQIAAAAAKRRSSLVRRTPKRPVPLPASSKRQMTLLAAADVPGYPVSSRLADMTEVAKAFMARSKGLPTTRIGGPEGTRLQYGVATFSRGIEAYGGLTDLNPEYAEPGSLQAAAAKESRLPGGSLLAAGGWCAPSETLYDLCDIRTGTDGLWDVAEVNVTRGGLRFTTGLDFSSIFTDGFWLTEAQVIAGQTKTCIEIDCPDFDEVRLDAVGICLKAPLLTNAAWPELVRQWIEAAMLGQQHRVSATLLPKAATMLGAAVAVGGAGTSASHDVLSALELVIEGLRQRERMNFNETMEVVAPHWLLPALRSDLAVRNGQTSGDAVTDEQIRGHFAARGARVQWVYDWQPLTLDANGVATAYPDTVNLLVYPAGVFVKGTADVINLDTVYDSTDLQSNMFMAAFVEEGVLLAQTCLGGAQIQVPVCVSGRTGAADITACFPEAATP